jgi:CheY-like chemotaxis protein
MGDKKDIKILLAEDNKIIQRIAQYTFRQLGNSVDIVSNGEEAIEMFSKNNYQLIFMDLQMPLIDGLEACRQIRALEKQLYPGSHAFIVALTANLISERKDDCLLAGMDDFMEKPFDNEKLRALIARIAE